MLRCLRRVAARLCDSGALGPIVKLGTLIHLSHLNHFFSPFFLFYFLFLNFLLSFNSSVFTLNVRSPYKHILFTTFEHLVLMLSCYSSIIVLYSCQEKIHISFFEACFQILYFHGCVCIYVTYMNKLAFKPSLACGLGFQDLQSLYKC